MTDLPTSKLMYQYCDGELTSEQAVQLHQQMESDPQFKAALRERFEQERRLRRCVSDVISKSCPCAPKMVHESVRSMLSETVVAMAASEANHSGSGVRRLIFETKRANLLAIAATLAMVAGAVLFGIFGRPIDDVASTPSDLVADAATFADQAHGLCAGAQDVMDKVPDRDPVLARADLSKLLNAPVTIFDLTSAGYEFVGAGCPCGMPVPAPAAHLVYKKTNYPASDKPMVSVFIVPNEGGCRGRLCYGLEAGQWCVVEGMTRSFHKVLRATDGRLVYFLVCCDERDIDAVKDLIAITLPARTR